MKTKHTPGPWSYGESIDSMWYVEAEGRMIAEVMVGEPGEAEANSMLMAAATDMLDALRHILRYDRDGLGAIGESLASAAVRKALGHNWILMQHNNGEQHGRKAEDLHR